jgi:hypothetical protein
MIWYNGAHDFLALCSDDETTLPERHTLTAAEVGQLVQWLNDVEKFIGDLSIPGAACSGYVLDFETAVVTDVFDSISGVYNLSCQSISN